MIRELLALVLVSILLTGCISSPAPEKGSLQITSSPPGAEIYLDNEYRGSTPATISEIEPGNHTIEFRLGGYRSWRSSVAVAPGSSNFFAGLTALPGSPTSQVSPLLTEAPVAITARIGSEQMIIGESNEFFGIATGTGSVTLTLYGPGYYQNGRVLDTVIPNVAGEWNYRWDPGTKIQPGEYSLVVQDAGRNRAMRAFFTAIGGGVVSVTPSSFSVGKGDSITISGRCTTGAPKVSVVLYGPERFGNGISLGTFPVLADQTWSFRYATDLSMPTGVYSITASDIPQTTSGTSQFTLGFVS